MSNKQSSVEWLMQKIALKYGTIQAIAFYNEFQEEFKQAKTMHKQEIESAFDIGADTYYDLDLPSNGEDYYYETFNTKEK